MFDDMNMHMPLTIAIVMGLLLLVVVGFLLTIGIVGGRIRADEEAGTSKSEPAEK